MRVPHDDAVDDWGSGAASLKAGGHPQVWLLLNGGKESGLAAGFAPAILRTIHTPADTADKLTAEGMPVRGTA